MMGPAESITVSNERETICFCRHLLRLEKAIRFFSTERDDIAIRLKNKSDGDNNDFLFPSFGGYNENNVQKPRR